MTHVAIATEDEISEHICALLVREAGLSVVQQLRRRGNGYLRSRIPSFCQMAAQYPVVVLTDLDGGRCAPSLLNDWVGERIVPENLLLRVAVREIEAWLLADAEAIIEFFRLKGVHNYDPEQVADPKQLLLTLARRAPRDIRADLLVDSGAIAAQGLGYNRRLVEFVSKCWSAERAEKFAPSLAKARLRLRELADRLGTN